MNDRILNRVQILIQQNRYKEAADGLAELLSMMPDNILVLAMYSQVCLELGENRKAKELIENAISIAPDVDGLFHVKARVMLRLDEYDEAEDCLQEAITLNPENADYYALWGNVKLVRKKYQAALDLADQALHLDAENLLALNTRSTALLKLNDKEAAFETIQGALRGNPNNAYTHANFGWSLLEKGDHEKALEHFREALKNDPNDRFAQAGMMEALKAKYFIYRGFLKYAFWMSNMTAQYQWIVIIGFYLLAQFLSRISENNPALQPYLFPILILMALIAFSTWVIPPLSNLFLRLNPYGKHLLDEKEKWSSNFVGGSLVIFLIGLAAYFLTNNGIDYSNEKWLGVAVFGFLMMVPFSTMFVESKPKNALLIFAIAMFVVGLAAVAIAFYTGELLSPVATLFLFGFIGYQWIANFLMIRKSNK